MYADAMPRLGELSNDPLDKIPSLLGRGWTFSSDVSPLSAPIKGRRIWSDNISLTVFEDPSAKDRFIVSFPALAEFEISFADRTIRGFPLAETGKEAVVSHLFADQILPRVLAHLGHLVMHAGAVDTPLGALVLAGLSGRGKSTLTASLHVMGNALLGDDAIVFSGGPGTMQCQAVYRSLRLLPDSIDSVFAAPPESSSVAHYTRKHSLHNLGGNRHVGPAPVRALCFLGEDQKQVWIRPMSPAEACMAVIQHSFALDPTDRGRARDRMMLASALTNALPVFELSYPRDYRRLAEVRAAILEQVGQLESLRASA